jgi:putative transposase
MSKTKRKFSKAEKLKVLTESKKNGVKATLEKHGIYPATFYSWRKKYAEMGEEGFRHGITPAQLKEIKRLEKENAVLKTIIAEKELESKLKDDLLKKKYPLTKKR